MKLRNERTKDEQTAESPVEITNLKAQGYKEVKASKTKQADKPDNKNA